MTGCSTSCPNWTHGVRTTPKFIGTYWLIANAVILFILIGHGMIVATGLGYPVKIGRTMPIGVGLLFIVLGNYSHVSSPTGSWASHPLDPVQ